MSFKKKRSDLYVTLKLKWVKELQMTLDVYELGRSQPLSLSSLQDPVVYNLR